MNRNVLEVEQPSPLFSKRVSIQVPETYRIFQALKSEIGRKNG
jgi:hypothetical protein